MMGAPTRLFVQALGLAVAFMASLGLASGQACNAGVQYFALPGYKTAAVFADGVMMLPPDFVFGDQVRPHHRCRVTVPMRPDAQNSELHSATA